MAVVFRVLYAYNNMWSTKIANCGFTAKLDELSQYKISGKVGARWAKIKTVSKFSTMGKNSARSQTEEKTSAKGSTRGSNLSLDRLSARSERSGKSQRKLSKEPKTKKNAKS